MKKHAWRDLSKYEWRIQTEEVDGVEVKIKQKRETVRLDTGWMTFDMKWLQEAIDSHHLSDVEFEIETEHNYGDEIAVMRMKGWRDATEQEVRDALNELDKQAADLASRQADMVRRQLADLKKTNPDLLRQALAEVTKEE